MSDNNSIRPFANGGLADKVLYESQHGPGIGVAPGETQLGALLKLAGVDPGIFGIWSPRPPSPIQAGALLGLMNP